MNFLRRSNSLVTDAEIKKVLQEEDAERCKMATDEERFWDDAAIEFYHCRAGSWSRKPENTKEHGSPSLWKEVDSKTFNDSRRAAKEFLASMAQRYLEMEVET